MQMERKTLITFNTLVYLSYIIQITHVFHALTFAGVPRKLFEHKTDRPSAQTSPEGPGKCKCNETNMCDRYSSIF